MMALLEQCCVYLLWLSTSDFFLLFQIYGVILIIAFTCLGNLLFQSNSWVFSTLRTSALWIVSHCCGLRLLRIFSGLNYNTQASSLLCVYGTLLCSVCVALKAVVRKPVLARPPPSPVKVLHRFFNKGSGYIHLCLLLDSSVKLVFKHYYVCCALKGASLS